MCCSDWISDVCSSDLTRRHSNGLFVDLVSFLLPTVEPGIGADQTPACPIFRAMKNIQSVRIAVDLIARKPAVRNSGTTFEPAPPIRAMANEQCRLRIIVYHPQRRDRKSTRLNSSH